MGEINISNNIILDDDDMIIERLRLFSGINAVGIDDVVGFIKNEANTHFYLDDKMNIKAEDDKGIKYLWLDTGLESTKGNRPLFISLINQDGYYVGHYIGDWKFLGNTIAQYFPTNIRMIRENTEKFKNKYEKRIDKRTNKHLTEQFKDIEESSNYDENKNKTENKNQYGNNINLNINNQQNHQERSDYLDFNKIKHDEVTKGVESVLMINNWKSINGLDRYLKVIGCRLIQLIEQDKPQYYVLNNIKSAIINTGLLNRFGADIHIMYRYNVTQKIYIAYKIMESKKDYIDNGFTKEQTVQDIVPINFFDEGEEIFDVTIDEFDVNHRSLLHIIEERRERFPENMQSLSDNMVATKINNALELGLKMQKRDRNYAKPTYSSKTKTISWMMPLHINKELTEEPELVLVIRRNGDFYEVKTIIPYDDEMKDKITALSLYNGLW
jgi:hypothetical protein